LINQKALDFPYRHASGVHGDDLVVKAGKAAVVLGNEIGTKLPS
jgi:hypothetical protein